MRKIVQAIFLIFLLSISNFIVAQSSVANYTFASAAGTYTAITGTNSTAVGDDNQQVPVPIGFNFILGSTNATHAGITTNGMITLGYFNETIGFTHDNNVLSTSASLRPLIAAFWDDNNRNTGTISYLTDGAFGARVFTVQWDNVNIGGLGTTSATFTASFQLKLFEGTNVVKLIYSNNFSAAGAITASIGLNDAASFLSVTPGSPATVSSITANNAIADLTNVMGKEYTFTPPVPACAPATYVTVSNITTTAATITMNAVSGATGYQFSVIDFTPPSAGTASATPAYASSGLTPNTQYYVHARTACAGGTFSAWYTTSFITSALFTIPYFQNFDTAVAPALPTYTSMQDLNAGTSWVTSTASSIASPYSAPNCLVFGSDPAIPANDWFYTPAISLTGGTSYQLSFYYKNISGSSTEKLEVKYGTTNNATAMTNLIYKDTNILNTNYKVVKQSFTPASSGAYYFGFHDFSNANQIALNIDDIRIINTPTCDMPTLLNVSFTSSTAGIASWAPATGAVSSYNCTILTSASAYITSFNPTTPSTNFGGLFPGQQYLLSVQTFCPGSTSSATAVLPFTMPAAVCTGLPVPYNENFDSSIVVPALKFCYTSQDLNGGTKWISEWRGSGSHSFPNVMVYKYDAVPANDWFFTPSIHLLAGSSYKISYKYAVGLDTDPEKLEVKYGTANNAASMSNLLVSDTNITNTFYLLRTKSFTPSATGDYYFGFHAFSNANAFYLFVDDINIDYALDCGAPTGLSASFNTQTSGTVSWGHTTAGTVSNYQYAVTTSPTPPDAGTLTTATSAAFTGLQASTVYYLHVKSLCNTGLFSFWTTYSFSTPCGAVNIPYLQNFDAATVPLLPNCMTKFDNNGGTAWQTDTTGARSAPNAMIYKFSASVAGDDWAFTPGLNLLAGVTYDLSFYYKGRSASFTEKLEVYYGNAATSVAMTNFLFNNAAITQTFYINGKVSFTAPSSGVFYIGFHAKSAANQYDLNIDDIKVDYTPGCWQPRNITKTFVSATEATISWSLPITGTPTGYEFSTSTYNAIPPSSGFVTSQQSFSMVGLLQGIKYYVFVRSTCTGGAFSAWAIDSLYIPCSARDVPYAENFDSVLSPVLPRCIITEDLNGGTTWNNSTLQPRSAPNCMNYRYNASLPGNDWFYLAPLNLTAGTKYRLAFYYKARTSGSMEKLRVKYGTANNAAAMTNILFVDSAITSTNYLKAEIDFVPISTGVYYIGFQSFSDADKFVLSVDDVSVKAAPNCGRSGFLSIVPASYNSALATWDSTASGAVTAFEYVINNSSFLPDSGMLINAGSLLLPNIIPETQYYFHLRTVCGASGTSLWTTVPFSIPCTSYPLPYIQNFDSSYYLPPCMRSQNINNDNYYWQVNELAANSSPFSMYYVTDNNANADDWFYTPAFNFTAGVSYRLSFYYKGSGPDVFGKMEVKYGNGNNALAMTNLLMKDTLINYTSFRKYQTDFVAASTGVFNIGFHAFSQVNQGVVYVDDVNLDVSPNCGEPVNVVINLINGNQGTASWSASTPGTPTGYQYVIDTSSSNPTVAGIATTDNLILLSGLNYFTQYYLHVKTICTNGNSIWVTKAFYTLPNDEPCNALNLILNGPQSCGSTTRATETQDPPLPVQCLPPNFTVWYKFTPTVNGRVILKTTIPSTTQPLYGSVGWYSLSGSCTDSASYNLVPGSVCSPFGGNGSGDIDSLQSPVLTAGNTYYIMISGIDYNWGDFCLNIISQPGNPQIYRFTGNGNWSDANNWENQLIPPAYLPGGDLIIIDNAAGGQCVLNITQYISTTGSLIVNSGKKLVMPGVLKIQ